MQKQEQSAIRSRAGRAINDLVVAELFLVQATIESASVLGEGISGLRQHLASDDSAEAPEEEFSAFLKRTREELMEPYSTRFKFFRDLVREQNAA
ncbi:MAG: hypothetical protein ABJ308_01625 [Halieaceae bacterium]